MRRGSSEKAIPLPDDIGFNTASAMLLQGLTAQYLIKDSYGVRPGDRLLVHAAGGGVGQALIQLAKAKGGRVVGLACTEEKRAVALTLGAEQAFGYSDEWPELVRDQSEAGFDAIFDKPSD